VTVNFSSQKHCRLQLSGGIASFWFVLTVICSLSVCPNGYLFAFGNNWLWCHPTKRRDAVIGQWGRQLKAVCRSADLTDRMSDDAGPPKINLEKQDLPFEMFGRFLGPRSLGRCCNLKDNTFLLTSRIHPSRIHPSRIHPSRIHPSRTDKVIVVAGLPVWCLFMPATQQHATES
jgi:hypothetical protein